MYENGKVYEGTFAGIHIRFSLENFSEKIINEFNSELIERAKNEIKNTDGGEGLLLP